jgi:fructokinase
MYGGIELGGTKCICAVGSGPDDIRAIERFPTSTHEKTVSQAIEFFQHYLAREGDLRAIGIGSFGPVDLNPKSPTYGHITTTPKPGWQFEKSFSVPIRFDTDVNAASLGEFRWGAAEGIDTFVYITVGTGIGGGAMVNGRLLHGMLHPEMGHLVLPRGYLRSGSYDQFAGTCPFHVTCLEGLASGPAIEKRWGRRAETLTPDHPAWELEAQYLALGVVNVIYILSPQRVILGGGVMSRDHLFPMIRAEVKQLLGEYLNVPQINEKIEEYIVPPRLGDRAGVMGAIALAEAALSENTAADKRR